MAEHLTRSEPIPQGPVTHADVRLALEPPMVRFSLRARESAELGAVLGKGVPTTIGAIEGDVLCLGPDEWLMRSAQGVQMPDGAGRRVSVVDVSERQVAISVDGARAVEVLQGGNPLDLVNFPVGSGKRTIFEGVEIILIRESETRFVVEVWRSFADFVWGELVKSASEL